MTLNHQELASKVSEAFCAISEALPEVGFLASELYPVPRIQSTLATMYTYIIDFCTRALRWYHKTRGGFIKKTWAAIADPWTLEFQDVVGQIQHAIARIRELAAIAHQAETRYGTSVNSQVQHDVIELKRDVRSVSSQVQQVVLRLQGERSMSASSLGAVLGELSNGG